MVNTKLYYYSIFVLISIFTIYITKPAPKIYVKTSESDCYNCKK